MPTLDKVSLDIQVVLGTTTMPIHQVLRLGRGAIIELEASEDDEVHPRQQLSGGQGHRDRQRKPHRGRSQGTDPASSPKSAEPERPAERPWPAVRPLFRPGSICYMRRVFSTRCRSGSRSTHMRSWRNW